MHGGDIDCPEQGIHTDPVICLGYTGKIHRFPIDQDQFHRGAWNIQ